MGFPSGVTLVTLTGNNLLDLEGNPVVSGTISFKASGQLADPTHGFIVVNLDFSTPVTNGVMVPVELPVNDATVNPLGFTVAVRQEFYYLKPDGSLSKTPVLRIYNLSLDSSYLPTVDLADIAPVSAFTPVNGITVVGTGSVNQVLTNLGNQTAGWRNSSGGGGSGTVTSVNNISPDGAGNVALTAAEVGADPSGAAGAAQTAAIATAATSAAGLYLPLAGGSLSGVLAMGGHKVTGGTAASAPTDLPIFSQIPVIGAAGSGAGNALSANDATTGNARTPTAHAASHAIGGGDLLTPDAIGAVSARWAEMLGYGLLTATPAESGVTYLQTPGDLVFCLCTPSKTKSISTLEIWVTAAGVTGSGVNALALFNEAGVLIDQTGDMTAAFSATGMASGAMGTAHTVTVGTSYYLGFLTHFSGTSPHFAATGTTQTANFPVMNGHRLAIFKSGQAAVPSSFDPSTYTPNSGYFIMGGR